MMKKNRILRMITALLLTGAMVIAEPGVIVMATETGVGGAGLLQSEDGMLSEGDDILVTEDEGYAADNSVTEEMVSNEEGELFTSELQEDEIATDILTSEEELTEQLAEDVTAEDEEQLTDEDNGYIGVLTSEQQDTANELRAELAKARGLKEDVDYVPDRAVFLADSREEAEQVADSYGAELVRLEGGVAVLGFEPGRTAADAMEEAVDAVDTLVEAQKIMAQKNMEGETGGLQPEGSDQDGSVLMSSEADIIEKASGIRASELPKVAIEFDYIYHIDVNPNDDPLYATSNMEPRGQWFHKSINSAGAWATGADGSGVTVAVIDTGIDTSNSDLNANIKQALYISDDNYNIYSSEDQNGHGTHCAGIIAGVDNTIGGLGVAPGAKIISIRALGPDGNGGISAIATAVQKAIDLKVDIISMSLGGSVNSSLLEGKINAAANAGIVCVASSGNDGVDQNNFPASYDSVIAVGAYDSDNMLAYYSNWGTWVDLAAPGSDILSTMPDTSAYQKCGFWDTFTGTCHYGKISGTSMATPVVAGVAALVKSKHKDYNRDRIRSALLESAKDKTYYYGNNKVSKGINALNAVNWTPGSGGGDNPGGGTSGDYLSIGAGPQIMLKQGKSVALGVTTSLDTKKNKITYSSSSTNNMITVSNGTVKANNRAPVGETAVITVKCGTLTAKTRVTVIDSKAASGKLTLVKEGDYNLSTVNGVGLNSVNLIIMNGDSDRSYRFEISGKNIAVFKNGRTSGYADSGNNVKVPVYARNNGTATITAYATDGSGFKASVKVTCVTPITDVNILCNGVPVTGSFAMAQGASLQLKPEAVGTATSKVTGKVTYEWSGRYVKNGRVTAPKSYESFDVTLKASNNGITKSKTITITSKFAPGYYTDSKGKRTKFDNKLVQMGYFSFDNKGKIRYYDSVNSFGDELGREYAAGRRYGIQHMPDLSGLSLYGPYGIIKKVSAYDCLYWKTDGNYTDYYNNRAYSSGGTNEGKLYTVSVSGPSVTNVTYSDYGVESFVPGKKGNYKFIFTSLDGSGRKFTINFKVTQDLTGNAESENTEVRSPGAFEF